MHKNKFVSVRFFLKFIGVLPDNVQALVLSKCGVLDDSIKLLRVKANAVLLALGPKLVQVLDCVIMEPCWLGRNVLFLDHRVHLRFPVNALINHSLVVVILLHNGVNCRLVLVKGLKHNCIFSS